MKIQKYLRDGCDTLEQKRTSLLDNHCVETKIETDISGREYLHLDYTIGAKPDPFVDECRGLVLSLPDFAIVRFPFKRFYNYEQPGRDKFDPEAPITYEEKLDGSLIIVHFIEGIGWNAGTRGRVFPDCNVRGYDITFPQLFWQIFGDKQDILDTRFQYFFELCAIENRVVVRYDESQVILLGGRWVKRYIDADGHWINRRWIDKDGYHEEMTDIIVDAEARRLGVRRPKVFEFDNIKAVLEAAHLLEATSEGFVIKQRRQDESDYRRAKVKSPTYIALHNIMTARSLNNLVMLVLQDLRATLTDFPEYLTAYDTIKQAIDEYWEKAHETYTNAAPILNNPKGNYKSNRKKFATEVCPTEYATICFALADLRFVTQQDWQDKYQTNSGIKNLILNLHLDKLVGEAWRIIDDVEEDI